MKMKESKYLTVDERLAKMESDILEIKAMLREVLSTQKGDNRNIGEKIMNVNEVAKFTGMEKHLVYANCAAGKMPFFKIGKLYKFKRSEIEKWMKEQRPDQKIDVDDYVNRYLQTHVLKG